MGVPGASIVEKGTTNGTITDFDGNYTLTVSNKNATLVFSFIGYKTQEIPVAGKAKVDVILQENAEQLDEVVVTGYGGSQKRATLTTSISKLITPYWKMQLWPMPDNLYKVRFPVYA